MKKIILCVIGCVAIATTAFGAHAHKEKYYQEQWAKAHNGQTEVILPNNKRIDILTDACAIEVDFAYKFYEAVGQALLYAAETGKTPGILLIIEKTSDIKYVKNLQTIIHYWKLPIKVWLIYNPDLL